MAREGEARTIVALVAAAWLVGLAPVLVGGRTFATEPHLAGSIPWFERMAGSIASGHLPEWDDSSGLGVAVALEPGRPLAYPPAWLVAALPLPWSIDAVLAAHLLLFGVGAALWARRLGAEPIGAAVAGSAAALWGATTGGLVEGGAVCAAAWLPWIGWAADRLAAESARGARHVVAGALLLAVLLGALLLAGGPSAAALAAPLVAAAALVSRAPARARAWFGLAAAAAAGVLLSAPAWLPAAAAGQLRPDSLAPGPVFRLAEMPALGLAMWGALASPPARRLALAVAALALVGLAAPGSLDGLPAAAGALAAPLAGLGASRSWAALERPGWARRRAAVGALLATAIIGPLAVRACRLPFQERDRLERPPALLADVVAAAPASASPLRPRIAWPAEPGRDRADGPAAAARFGFAVVPGRDRSRDPQLARLWLAAAGAGERLLDLFAVEYAVLPASVAVPAAKPVAGRSADGRVLAENRPRRPRAFVAPRWTWTADRDDLAGELFPDAPDQGGSLALAQVRLLGSGPPPPPERPGPEPAPPCAIASERPEEVELRCRSAGGGYAVLLDRDAPGWSAELDGAPAPIVTADLLARAVAIGPGPRRVRFVYRTPGLRLGGALAGAAWLNAAALALLLYRMRANAARGIRGQPRTSVVPIEPG